MDKEWCFMFFLTNSKQIALKFENQKDPGSPSQKCFAAYKESWGESVGSGEIFGTFDWNEIWGYLWIPMIYLFWGIICPLLPEVIVTWVFA